MFRRPCDAPVRWRASNFELQGLLRRCVQISSLQSEVIWNNECGADGLGMQELLEMHDAIKPTETAVLHEKLDSLRGLLSQRDYDMRGRLDQQVWSFDARVLKCEGDIRRVEQVSVDRARKQQLDGWIPKDKMTSSPTDEYDRRQPLQVGEAVAGGDESGDYAVASDTPVEHLAGTPTEATVVENGSRTHLSSGELARSKPVDVEA